MLLDTFHDEVNSALMGLKTDSTPGWENITTTFLKHSRNKVIPIICHLTNLCFASGVFSSLLKIAIITPIHKVGDKGDVNNYRPISVLPSISKVLEKLINNRIIRYLDIF